MIRAGVRRVLHLALRRRDRWEREVEEEIKLHLALRAEQLMARGEDADAAYAEAVRRFGPLKESRARLFDEARQREVRMRRVELFEDLRQDVAFALRTLRRQKGWTTVTVLTLALGIGATTAVFSVVSSLLLHPLPYPSAGRIVLVDQQPNEGNNTGISVSITPPAPTVLDWRRAHSFEALEGYRFGKRTLATNGDPVSIDAVSYTPGFAALAGAKPLLGRTFSDADVATESKIVVLSESFWRSRFASDPAIVGKTVLLSDTVYAIIGVMPATFRHPRLASAPADVWLPIDLRDKRAGMSLIGRLRPGVTAAAAQTELDSISARGAFYGQGKLPFLAHVTTPAERVNFHDSLILLTVAVGFVLLVACANVAHLLVARSASRQRELAMRVALGAGRGRIFRQLLTESLLLSGAGSLLGLGLGWIGLRALIALRPPVLSELAVAHLDGTTLAVGIGLALISGLLFGVLGSLHSMGVSTHDALKNGAMSGSASRRQTRGRGLLIVGEMALSAALVVGATMLIRSVIRLQQADVGFNPESLYAVQLRIPRSRYPSPEAGAALVSELAARFGAAPGVRAVTAAGAPPGERNFLVGHLEVDGEPSPPPSTTMGFIDANDVRPNYFATMGIPLVEGSTFSDTSSAANQVIVNAGFARKHWKGSALGHRVRVTYVGDEPWGTIVGVAKDAATGGAGGEMTAPFIYTPMRAKRLDNSVALLVRTDGRAETVAGLRPIVREVDAKLVTPVSAAADVLAGAIAAPRFVMLLLTIFTGLALILAAIGMYGVMTYAVVQRTREIGIRVALGASAARVAGSILARGAALAAAGALIGLASALWGTRLLEHQLYGVTRSDPVSFAAGIILLLAAALAACAVPTRRALGVDPITAIRAD